MVFGNVDTERLQLNEDTHLGGRTARLQQPARRRRRCRQIRQLVFANQWTPGAGPCIDQNMLGNPAAQLAYQPVGDLGCLRRRGRRGPEYPRWPRPDHGRDRS